MINCNNFSENVCAYIDDELSIEERLSFDEHVRNCKACRRELEEMTSVVNLCRSLPQQELPADFGNELHERLAAVSGRQERKDGPDSRDLPGNKVRDLKKPRGYLLLKTFAAVAAGLLLVFIAGSFFKYGLPSPKTGSANNTAMSAVQPEAARDEGAAKTNGNTKVTASAPDQASAFSAIAPAAQSAGTAEVDRSAKIQNRETAAALKASKSETASSKLSTIIIAVGDPYAQVEKIKQLVSDNSGEVAENPASQTFSANTLMKQEDSSKTAGILSNDGKSAGVQPEESAADVQAAAGKAETPQQEYAGSGKVQLQLSYTIPYTQYDQFIKALSTQFGAANVQNGTVVTEDVTEALNGSIAQSDELDSRIRELQKEDGGKNDAEINELKAQKESTDKRIDELRLGNDFVTVTIFINGK